MVDVGQEGTPTMGSMPTPNPVLSTDSPGNIMASVNQNPLSSLLNLPNIIIPKPFNISDFKDDLESIKKQTLDEVASWETRMTTFFGEYDEYTDNWRVVPRNLRNKPRGLFNSKSGETHRAVETKSTTWFRMLTAADPFFEAVGEGLDDFGRELTEEDLYAVEIVTKKQLQFIRFKEKLMRWLRSLSLFGTAIFEAPYTSFPYGGGRKYFEGTDMVVRSLLTTGFNPFVFDLHESEYIFNIDFPTIGMIRNWSNNDKKNWDSGRVEEIFQSHKNYNQTGNANKTVTYNRVLQRKLRAGYNFLDSDAWELITRHGRIDINNNAVQAYWESEGRQDDPSFCDFTVGVLQGEGVVRFHATPFGTWHHLYKHASDKLFEMEPLGYGVGKIGRKGQKETDQIYSRVNDVLMFSLLNMWKISKYAGLNVGQLTIKPWAMIELEDIKGIEPLRPQIEAIASGLGLLGDKRQDFRFTVGAPDTLQAQGGGSSATESAITQNEGMRSVGVQAEIIAETLRDFLYSNHINNLAFMDNGMWVKFSAETKPMLMNKNNLPVNVGFNIKPTTDKDFRPDLMQRIMEAIQVTTSIRQNDPKTPIIIEHLWKLWFRTAGMDMRILNKQPTLADQIIQSIQKSGQQGLLKNEVQGEMAGSPAGGGQNLMPSPVGPVPTSPVGSMPNQKMSA